MTAESAEPPDGASASQMAWASISVNVGLTALNLAIAAASGSLAVAAEMVHNLVDLLASAAVLLGIKISERKSQAFPYGLYKIENVVAVLVAISVFFTGYEITLTALGARAGVVSVNGLMLTGVALSATIPLLFSHFEMRAGRRLNSPSLIAEAQEYRVHVFSSGTVLLALLAQMVGVPLDRYAALIVVLFIARTGWQLLSDGMRVLLDASLDPKTLDEVKATIMADAAVAEVRTLVGRSAGRYRFLEGEVALRVHSLEKAHAASLRIEKAIRDHVPHVERVRILCEPQSRTYLHYAVPLADTTGTISHHFGEAPYFALVTVRTADGRTERQEVVANPHQDVEKGKGIRVAEWLVSLKVDIVLLREDVQGKGPAYVFADAAVETRPTEAANLAQALAEQTDQPGSAGVG